jgi:uncharacterized membrane protein
MVVQVAILAWIFLGDRLNTQQVIGLIFAVWGVLIVQLRFTKRKIKP